MKRLYIIAFSLGLMGCGASQRFCAAWSCTGTETTCVDGVTYMQFTSGATVKVDRDGKPVPCESR